MKITTKKPLLLALSSAAVLGLSACGSDAEFEPSMRAAACSGTTASPDRLFLQQVSDSRAIIKWRNAPKVVCLGTDANNLNLQVNAQSTEGNHEEALITGLTADTTYYYSVGGANALSEADAAKYHFRTAPTTGNAPSDGTTRIWLVGDSGTASDGEHPGEAQAVYDGFKTFNGDNQVDLFVMLGDNAYDVGRDVDYQVAVFDLYEPLLAQTPVWSTVGNHEMGGSFAQAPKAMVDAFVGNGYDCPEVAPDTCVIPAGGIHYGHDPAEYNDLDPSTQDNGLPYLDIFSFPTQAEVGGAASGTELYYSFDYANVHVVNLDSQLSVRDSDKREAMKDWLIADLDANTQDWTVVIFHHPPYSKGENHDSDLGALDVITLNGMDIPNPDRPIGYMREEFNSIFEAKGVDVVYSGHSHSYERSYYISGHTGTSDTFDAATHADMDGAQPRLSNYKQVRDASNEDDKVIYTVNGSSGKANYDVNLAPLNHPAHRAFDGSQMPQLSADDQMKVMPNGIALKGSVVLDATATSLTANFIDVHGEVLDTFTMTRN